MQTFLLYLYTESPLHAGAADADRGIDLPIQREAATNYPVVWGQSLKGALRRSINEALRRQEHDLLNKDDVTWLFGPPPRSGGDDVDQDPAAGNLLVGDAQLVAMPVPTLQHTFAWATSGLALGRLARKYQGLKGSPQIPEVPTPPPGSGYTSTSRWNSAKAEGKGHVLGPCVVPLEEHQAVGSWSQRIGADALPTPHEGQTTDPFSYFRSQLNQDLLVVGDTAMSQLVRECTEHTVRVQLNDETKTVEHGPFTAEYLPTDSVLAATLTLRSNASGADDDGTVTALYAEQLRTALDGTSWQLGGDETIGKGQLWSRLIGDKDE
ncbi:type III-B CRISPR module RAMP protein Cmr4 [Lipingzhangella sp. LS1_29]|uniref:Type III-B CRISPR module RAMP protein Cmr4 n=1 Tax=Lipingzhangella rawalii TaxID=2055835 RepID=A0ABU2H325_9ACTN|nr:type III-B CRISPR module RAMP protein Cmr4 [Lipingzhangella rawalii]MDS1269710.1 type III-B CRISPR module RAMP protein Cmr4 [Lipingzhangella rawalii]